MASAIRVTECIAARTPLRIKARRLPGRRQTRRRRRFPCARLRSETYEIPICPRRNDTRLFCWPYQGLLMLYCVRSHTVPETVRGLHSFLRHVEIGGSGEARAWLNEGDRRC